VRTRSRDDFTTIRTEGQILPPDLLTRIVERDKDLEGFDPASYHLVGQTINEAISRSWTVLQGAWASFKDRRVALPEGQPETQMPRERWLLPLFRYYEPSREAKSRVSQSQLFLDHWWSSCSLSFVTVPESAFRAPTSIRALAFAGGRSTSDHAMTPSSVAVRLQ
jgi:hypothetical protein